MFSSLSIQTRFLVAPFLGAVLTLILYLASNQVIESNSALFKDISKTNLVQISEINQISLLIAESNSEIITLLLESEKLDEEGIYVEGKKRLNHLYDIEKRLNKTIKTKVSLIINEEDIFQLIQVAFTAYKSQAISSIEMSSVNIKQASYELILANEKLRHLNSLFLKLSAYYSSALSEQANLLEGTLYKKHYIAELTVALLVLMLWSAFYFSKNTSLRINQVYKALMTLASGNTNITIQKNKDTFIQDIWNAISEFKESIEKSEIYKNDLLTQKFAIDQHSIIATTDIKGTITSANAKFCEISGYSEHELVGSNHRIINSKHHPKSFWTDMFKAVSKGGVWSSEVLNKAKDGRLYWVDTTIIPLTSVDKKITGYISIRTDITEKKSQHQKLIDANVAAESAVVAKSQFLAAMSHEIRTPMNGVIGMLSLTLDNDLSAEQKKNIDIALNSAKSLLHLINDILDFSKIEAGKLEIEHVNFDLESMIEELIQFMDFQNADKKLKITLDCSEITETMVVGDEGRVRQILTNIIGNAIKFTEQGEINLCGKMSSLNNNTWQFQCAITDTGIGIPADKLENLFDAFHQVDLSNTRKYGGTGLGLAISSQLAKLMHGDIRVRSEVGKGSCFTCTIELGKVTSSEVAESSADKSFDHNSIPQWPSDTRLLLVEDNRVNQLVAQGVLKRFGLKADVAITGLDALIKLKAASTPYSLILMDCQMPEMDGYEATRTIRENKDNVFKQDVPIIAMTANAMKGDREKCLTAGMNDYLTKPIEPELLLDKLKYWLLKQ